MVKALADFKNKFSGKKVTLMGLGLLGRGVGDALFLAKCGAELTITDLKTAEQLKTSLNKLKKYPEIKLVLGQHRLEDFQTADFIFKAAGVPQDSPFIAEARKNKIPILMSTALFAQMSGAKIIGVTGTRGKTTTTHLLYQILQNYYRDNKKTQVFLGGNIKGLSTLALLSKTRSTDIVVLELDSWQLQGFGELRISPQVAVFTSFMPDHLNYYHGDLDTYFADKALIFKAQSEKDFLIVEKNIAAKIQAQNPRAQLIIAQAEDLSDQWKLQIPGAHNKSNIACAVAAARALDIPEEVIQKSVEDFKGVEGRLELRGIFNGVKIYNDTTATTPTATLAALRAIETEKISGQKTILIFGGSDKQLDMSELLENLPRHCQSAILLAGSGSTRIEADFLKLKKVLAVKKAKTLKTALKLAVKQAQTGDTILFSPAFASFGMFKNEYDRGEKFNKLLIKISESKDKKIELKDFSRIKQIYFFGIGGIGISALARMFLIEGKKIGGCDLNFSEITSELKNLGVEITQGQKIDFVPRETDLIIYTAAIPVADEKLFQQIKELKIPSLSYPEALGIVALDKKTIAVAGTHGKTTTTAMLAEILLAAGLDPTVIIGSLLKNQQSNFVAGKSQYLVVEADEYRRAFLNLKPYILIINNLDLDHLDYYRDLADIQSAYRQLISQVNPQGVIITQMENSHIAPILVDAPAKVIDYSKIDIKNLKLKVPGEHNRQNARAAWAVAEFLGVKEDQTREALEKFAGVWRRFEYKGQMKNGAVVYDDYAHNPQKVRAVLSGAREMFPQKRIVAVFQPHLYSRTKALLADFASVFAGAGVVIVLPIYAAREAFDPAISSEILAREISKQQPELSVLTVKDFDQAQIEIEKLAQADDLILFMGAGDGYLLAERLVG